MLSSQRPHDEDRSRMLLNEWVHTEIPRWFRPGGEPQAPSQEQVLLTEIRDLLKERR